MQSIYLIPPISHCTGYGGNSACQKSPCGTFLTALSAGRFDSVKTPLRANGLFFKPFDGGLSHLRRALPPQAPPRPIWFRFRKRSLTVSIPPISHCTGYGGNSNYINLYQFFYPALAIKREPGFFQLFRRQPVSGDEPAAEAAVIYPAAAAGRAVFF